MAEFTATKIMLLITLILALLLSIISMAGSFQDNKIQPTTRAFSVLGFIFILAALVIFVMLFFACSDKAKLLMIVVAVLAALCLISEAIALGVLSKAVLDADKWLMATIWMSLPVIAGALLTIFMDEGF